MLFNVTLCPAPAMASLKLIAAAERGEKVGKKSERDLVRMSKQEQ
jgi:hypothetical protein